jgi:hypothetical protein
MSPAGETADMQQFSSYFALPVVAEVLGKNYYVFI